MEENITIRKAVPSDIAQLVQMRMDYLYESQGEEQVKKCTDLKTKTEAFFDKYLGNYLDVVVAEANGGIIAVFCSFYLTLLPRLDSKNSNKRAKLLFDYIKPEYVDDELKKALYKKLIKNAKEQESGAFEIAVIAEEIPRYETFGFIKGGYPPIELWLGKNSVWRKRTCEVKKNITIRKANNSDIPQLVEMRVKYLCELSGIEQVRNISDLNNRIKIYLEEHLDKDLDIFVAEWSGEIISTCFTLYFDIIPDIEILNGKVGIPINSYTKPQYRNKGLSKALFVFSAKHAEKRGVELLEMEIPEGSRKFYEEFGFEPMATIPTQLEL